MREIDVGTVSEAVRELFLRANKCLPAELEAVIKSSGAREGNERARAVFSDMLMNLDAARELSVPICQDTGMAVLFMDVGQDVHFTGGDIAEAVNLGVHMAYLDGLLRCSVVSDPLERKNTGDNTPALIHTRIVPGDRVSLTAAPKGFGSENMSRIKMFTPSASRDDIIEFTAECMRIAGGNPCPPVVLGVGIGSDFEGCALLAKRALCRSVSEDNPNPQYASLEREMLERINSLGIGPQGFGGDITALKVNIEYAPTHIAGLPVAVNVGCHVTRHAHAVL